MKDAKGNTVKVGIRLYASLGDYGPCATIVDFKVDPFEGGYDCAYIRYDSELRSFPISVDSLRNSYWSATATWEQRKNNWWRQEIKYPLKTWWNAFRYELKKHLKVTKTRSHENKTL
jgi:hypothetical protein